MPLPEPSYGALIDKVWFQVDEGLDETMTSTATGS